jgi:hypothetical protein
VEAGVSGVAAALEEDGEVALEEDGEDSAAAEVVGGLEVVPLGAEVVAVLGGAGEGQRCRPAVQVQTPPRAAFAARGARSLRVDRININRSMSLSAHVRFVFLSSG